MIRGVGLEGLSTGECFKPKSLSMKIADGSGIFHANLPTCPAICVHFGQPAKASNGQTMWLALRRSGSELLFPGMGDAASGRVRRKCPVSFRRGPGHASFRTHLRCLHPRNGSVQTRQIQARSKQNLFHSNRSFHSKPRSGERIQPGASEARPPVGRKHLSSPERAAEWAHPLCRPFGA